MTVDLRYIVGAVRAPQGYGYEPFNHRRMCAKYSSHCGACLGRLRKGREIAYIPDGLYAWNTRTKRHDYSCKVMDWECYLKWLPGYIGYCEYCGAEDRELTVDHIVPRSRGGADEPYNFAVACRSCNSSKGARDVTEFVTSLRFANG